MQTLSQLQQENRPPAKDLLNNRYQKVKRLGEGSYGTVYLAIDTKPEGISRKADAKALQLLEKVVEEPPFSEDVVMKDAAAEAGKKEAL